MLIITLASLSGGQGKTTTAFFLARILAEKGMRVLTIDADPQANLTFYLGHDVNPDLPTLLEVIRGVVPPDQAIFKAQDRLDIMPSDNGLNDAQQYLASSGFGAAVLKRRLEPLRGTYEVCIIDSPPQGMHLSLGAIAACDLLLIPAEAGSKGVNSVLRTLEAVKELKGFKLFQGEVLGVLPFKDKWKGLSQTLCSRKAIEGMKTVAGDIKVWNSILDSEPYRKAMDSGRMPDAGTQALSPVIEIANEVQGRIECLTK